MFKLPPQHRADARHVFVSALDPAWDHDKIDSEKAKMADAKEDPEQHPFHRYGRGEGRYDLGAQYPVLGDQHSPSEYFKDGEKPAKFELAELDVREFYDVQDMLGSSGGANKVWFKAALLGLIGCDGLDLPRSGSGSGKRVTEEGLGILKDIPESEGTLPLEIGVAVWRLSQPATEAEKKP